MTLTVGELVAYAKVDRSDFKRGTKEIAADLRSLQSSTSSSMAGMEGSVVRSLADIQRAIADGLDPADAIRELDRLEAALDQSLDSMVDDADRFAAELEREIDQAFSKLDEKRYGELDLEVDADITQALAELKRLEAEAGESGERAGDRFSRGVDSRLKGAKGLDATALFDGLVDGADKAADAAGASFEAGMGVLGKAGPANVAIVVAALQALPTVAGVVAGGIVTAVGGGLLAVGLANAATADDVQKAWKDTVAEIKRETADAAQPLEGSAIRAADVTRRAFDQLKPFLKRTFQDLVPDVDHFVEMAGFSLGTLGPTFERLGDSFGNILSKLGDRMPAIVANLDDMLSTFADMADENPQMLADLVEDATELLAVGAEVLAWADDISAVLTLPINPSGANNKIWEAMFGTSYDDFQRQSSELPRTLGGINTTVAGAILALQGVGEEGDNAADGVRNFSAALEELFDPAAKALDAEIRLKDALRDAAAAAKDKKTSEVDRLKSVQDITRAVADAAQVEHERTGKTNEASAAFARQLPTLAELAGKNDAARDAVTGLGNSLGVTIKRTDDGKIAVDRFGKAVVTLPNGKQVKIDADTAKALSGLQDTKKKTDDLKDKKVKVDADTKGAVGEVGKVTKGLDGLKGEAQKAGQGIGSGLVAGIRSMIGEAAAAAKSLASSALAAAKNFLGIKSPSTVMAEVGKWTVQGLIKGLKDEESQAVSTVEQMVSKIKDAFGSKPDVADHLLTFISKGNDSLAALAKRRDEIVAQLAAAKEMAKQVAGNAQEWADITGLKAEDFTGAGDMAEELKNKASAINNFANNITKLAKMGLNKKIIQDIIDAGVEKGATFAEMLVGSDGSEIKALNKAQAAVDKASKKLGKSSADAMYDVGKRSGDGYLKGLEESLKDIDKAMKKIVDALVKAIKKELKIKSPSQVMADIGMQAAVGLAVGITDGTNAVVESVKAIAKQAATTAASSLGGNSAAMLAGSYATVPEMGIGYVGQPGTGVDYKTPPQAPAGGGVNVAVDLSGSTIQEKADVPALATAIGYEVLAVI